MVATPSSSMDRARRRNFRSPFVICGASAGIVITASHNPPHDNGYKVYFDDGAQVVEPHASGIIAKVNAIESETYAPVPPNEQGRSHQRSDARSTSLHGAPGNPDPRSGSGSRRKRPAHCFHADPWHRRRHHQADAGAARLQLSTSSRSRIDSMDDFPTVQSPNPENAEALQLGIELAKKQNADLVIATDPDCDRMGVAVRNARAAR